MAALCGVAEPSLETMIELEQLHWGIVKPDALFLVERKSAALDDGNELQDRYRNLAKRERTHSRVVTLHNNSSIEDALDEVWETITSTTHRLTEGREIPAVAQPSGQPSLPETGTPQPPRLSRLSPAKPTVVYDTYWRFAAKRQEVFCPPT